VNPLRFGSIVIYSNDNLPPHHTTMPKRKSEEPTDVSIRSAPYSHSKVRVADTLVETPLLNERSAMSGDKTLPPLPSPPPMATRR
jgi:hypothetical protein